MRGAISRALLDAARLEPPKDRAAILARAAKAVVAIEAASPMTWVPIADQMLLNEALFATLGTERAVTAWRRAMTTAFERPLLRGFIKMSTDLFGMTPSAFLRQADRIYPYMTRGLGQVRFEADASGSSGRFTLRAFPSTRYDFKCYAEGIRGCLDATFDACGVTGASLIEGRDDALGIARYGVRWARRPEG